MAEQVYCSNCSCRTFYVMLADDGSVDVYCATNNHKRTLVNIPELVAHLYKTESEDSNSVERLRDTTTTIDAQAEVSSGQETNNPAAKHGS